MKIRVLADGADGFRMLTPDDVVVGWVRGRTVGVAGFDDEPAAISGAIRAFSRIAQSLEHEHHLAVPPIEGRTISIIHDGAYKWIAAEHVPIARLLVRAPHDFASGPQHAFEIVLPARVNDGLAIRAGLLAVATLTGSNGSAEMVGAVANHPSAVYV